MITTLEIENFKSIGSPGVCIELRPITLLFGPNSAGKSTIIQALQYLRHLVLYESGDVDRTDQVSGALDLGGFRRLVHQRDLDRAIRIRIEHTRKTWMDLWLWERFIEPHCEAGSSMQSESLLKEMVESIGMEVEVRWSHLKAAPYIAAYRVFVNGIQTAEVSGDADKNFIQMRSQSYEAAFEAALARLQGSDEMREGLRGALQDIDQYLGDQTNAVVGNAIGLFSNPMRRVIPDPKATEAHWLAPETSQLDYMGADHQREAFHIISALVIGPAYLTWRELVNLRYIGPIRDVPTRLLQEVAADSDLSWSRGNAAWNALFKGTTDFVQEVSDWLGRKDRLDTGYGVRIKQVVELADDVLLTRFLQGDDLEILEDLRQKLRSTPKRKQVVLVEEESGLELAPGEVGTGLSQVVPVAVAALEPNRTFVAVEQPELHVHPRVQTGLADLLIRGTGSDYDEEGESAVDAPPIFLIETHSEHLMLRLLRRIEESTDGVSPDHIRPIAPADLSVNYLYTDPAKHQLQVVPLRVDNRGEFIDKWPHGFFGERADELFR